MLQEFVETWLLEPLALAAAEPAERFGPVLQRRYFQREESRSNFRGTDAAQVDWPVVGADASGHFGQGALAGRCRLRLKMQLANLLF